MSAADWTAIARLVADGVSVAAGDKVSVFVTDGAASDAAAAFVDEGWRRGAVVQVLATDERFDAGALRWAAESVLRSPMPLEAMAMRWSDVHVSFRAMTSPVADADPRRLAALRRGRGAVSTLRWQGTRWALVRVPTRGWAEAMGVDGDVMLREWSASFDADWGAARGRMQSLCDRLDGAGSAVIDDEWGSLELDLTGRSWVPFAGNANWPDGEVATAPVETGVDGVIGFPGVLSFAGVLVRDLQLRLVGGVVVEERAAQGLGFVRELLATDDGARRVGELGVGTNAALSTMTGDLLIDEKILGTVHLALGRAYPECGGVNSSTLHWDIVKDLRGGARTPVGSLRVGEDVLIDRGLVSPVLAAASVAGAVQT